MRRGSLSRRVALLVSLGFAAIWLLSMFVTGLALRSEQAELFDQELEQTALLFRPIVTQALASGELNVHIVNRMLQSQAAGDPDEVLIYQILHKDGGPIIQSRHFSDADPPTGPIEAGITQSATHVFYTTDFNSSGIAVRIGDPLRERKEAYFDSFIAFLLPMLAMVPLAYFMVGWIARTALRPLDHMRQNITERGDLRLDPIDTKGQPAELAAITASINGFMIRLSQSLEGERAFASTAAHELRTPVAVALAQIQRLQAHTQSAADGAALARANDALRRLARLVARLLQMARADAGVGVSEGPTDIAKTLRHVIEESARAPARAGRIAASLPDGPVMSHLDADAFAIVAGNLIDNAFQHGVDDSTVEITLTQSGVLSVINDGPVVTDADISRLKERLHQGTSARDGFGLGLYISETIARQVGGALDLQSPPNGRSSGFEARFSAPPP